MSDGFLVSYFKNLFIPHCYGEKIDYKDDPTLGGPQRLCWNLNKCNGKSWIYPKRYKTNRGTANQSTKL